MAERIVHLSITHLFDGNHNHPGIPQFIEAFSTALYSGDGKMPQMLERLEIGADFAIRLLVGIPQKTMTRKQRLVAEAFCVMLFGRTTGDTKNLWSYRTGWQPKNPDRQPATLPESVLDREYMLSLGISRSIWCNDILLAPTAFAADNKPRRATSMRYLFALAAYGFSDPYQFFTKKPEQE